MSSAALAADESQSHGSQPRRRSPAVEAEPSAQGAARRGGMAPPEARARRINAVLGQRLGNSLEIKASEQGKNADLGICGWSDRQFP